MAGGAVAEEVVERVGLRICCVRELGLGIFAVAWLRVCRAQ